MHNTEKRERKIEPLRLPQRGTTTSRHSWHTQSIPLSLSILVSGRSSSAV